MKLNFHPLSGYSMKVLLAFGEKKITDFKKNIINLMDPTQKEEYRKTYGIGKVPCLELEDGTILPESSNIVEWIDNKYNTGLIPTDKEEARIARYFDRISDLYIQDSVGTIFFDNMKPENERNPVAVTEAKRRLDYCYDLLDSHLENREWITDNYSIADNSAFPGLFWAQKVYPYTDRKNIASYFQRVLNRPTTQTLMSEYVGPALEEWEKSAKI